MAKKKTVWVAKDGSYHDSIVDADTHDERIAFGKFVDEHPIYGDSEGCKIMGEDVLRWLDEHKEVYMCLVRHHFKVPEVEDASA